MKYQYLLLALVAGLEAAKKCDCVGADVACLAKCLNLPNPTEEQASLTQDCNTECTQSGRGDDTCFENCVKDVFLKTKEDPTSSSKSSTSETSTKSTSTSTSKDTKTTSSSDTKESTKTTSSETDSKTKNSTQTDKPEETKSSNETKTSSDKPKPTESKNATTTSKNTTTSSKSNNTIVDPNSSAPKYLVLSSTFLVGSFLASYLL